jgi:hypothetical protein
MVQDWHWSIQDLPLLLWPTSKVEHLSLIKSFGVRFIMLTPLPTRRLPFHYAIKPQQKQHSPYQWLDVLKVLQNLVKIIFLVFLSAWLQKYYEEP